MKIESHQIDEIRDKTIRFVVERKYYARLSKYLKAKGYSVGGTETSEIGEGMSEVEIDSQELWDFAVGFLNQTLADFDDKSV